MLEHIKPYPILPCLNIIGALCDYWGLVACFAMSQVFFTADHHFDHHSIIARPDGWGWRNFDDVREMNETLIDRWNSRVRRGDRVYHLGDFQFTWAKRVDSASIARRLNGQKYLVKGNHDRTSTWGEQLVNEFVWIKERFQLRLKGAGPQNRHVYFFLDHYPLRGWNRRFHGAIHLFGHGEVGR